MPKTSKTTRLPFVLNHEDTCMASVEKKLQKNDTLISWNKEGSFNKNFAPKAMQIPQIWNKKVKDIVFWCFGHFIVLEKVWTKSS